MKIIKCPSCGANIENDIKTCTYCGTTFDNEDTKINIEIVQKVESEKKEYSTMTSSELANELRNLKSKNRRNIYISVIPVLIVAVFLCTSVVIAENIRSNIRLLGMGSFMMTFLPIILSIFAIISVMVSVLTRPTQRYLNKIVNLLNENNVDEAYAFAKEKMFANDHMIAIATLIAFYIKQDYVFASTNIRRISANTFYDFEQHTDILTKASFEMDYVPPSN